MKRMLARGFFPAELPPPFTTRAFAAHMTTNAPAAPYASPAGKEPNFVTRPAQFNLARAGALRRSLAIPNPVSFFQLASVLDTHWSTIDKFYGKSDRAMSRPKPAPFWPSTARAYVWSQDLSNLETRKLSLRTGMRYALRADIRTFYPSVYTHSIPWALHGKAKSQSTIGYAKLLGNKIDRHLQLMQSKQTKGIPIGPDTSLLVAEILLARIDRNLQKEFGSGFFRYLDDYEFSFRSFNDAERGLAKFQEVLAEFELSANETKTTIFDLPASVDAPWPRMLRNLPLSDLSKPRSQRTHLLDLFNCAQENWRSFPEQSVVQYAVKRTTGSVVEPSNWLLYQQILLSWAQSEPSVLPLVIDLLQLYRNAGYVIDQGKVSETLNSLVRTHALRGHTSEVAWAIWGHILFNIKLDSTAYNVLRRIDNPVIALLTLDARSKKLVPKNIGLDKWKQHMNPEALVNEQWLLAYDARLKKWLPPVGAKNYITTAPGFDNLAAAAVSFYDETCSHAYAPTSNLLLRARLTSLTLGY